MQEIMIEPVMSDAEADALGGTFLDENSHRICAGESSLKIRRPDGRPLLVYCKNALPMNFCRRAWPALRKAAKPSRNRGMAGGIVDPEGADVPQNVATATRTRLYRRKRDNAITRTNESRPVESGIIGYFDRSRRMPFCRLTSFNLEHPDRFASAWPFICAVDRVFGRTLPGRYAYQSNMIRRTHPDFYIHHTVFTTLTVNRNWQTAVHKDAGDLPGGFGVMSALRAGDYDGGRLVFPKWGVAVDLRTRDVLLADVHEWHGNTPIVGKAGRFERISCVFYYRANMVQCGSASEELERAKNRKLGDPING